MTDASKFHLSPDSMAKIAEAGKKLRDGLKTRRADLKLHDFGERGVAPPSNVIQIDGVLLKKPDDQS